MPRQNNKHENEQHNRNEEDVDGVRTRPPSSDVEAEAAAQHARDHLQSHSLQQNPNSSFVTWAATLQPENAYAAIDPRFDTPNNPWKVVLEEVTQDLQTHRPQQPAAAASAPPPPPSAPCASSNNPTPSAPPLESESEKWNAVNEPISIPFATVVVVPDPEPPVEPPRLQENHAATEPQDTHIKNKNVGGLGLIDFVVGGVLVISSASVAVLLELVAIYLYLSSWICYNIAEKCSTPRVTCCKVLPFAICWLLQRIFQFTEVLLFYSSVFTVELLAGVGLVLCTIFSLNCSAGKKSHQRIRKVAHVSRCAFRKPFESWTPSRATGMKCCASQCSNASKSKNDQRQERQHNSRLKDHQPTHAGEQEYMPKATAVQFLPA